jgi:predicted dehydrogenase
MSGHYPSLGAAQFRVAVIGAKGYNASNRVAPALHPWEKLLSVVGFDLKPDEPGLWPHHVVRDDVDLRRQLKTFRPNVVVIETLDEQHREHTRFALEAGAQRVFCEKTFAAAPGEFVAADQAKIRVLDHYRMLQGILWLAEHARRWLGDIRCLHVYLSEEQGIPPHQESSHRFGMANFFHHVLAIAQLFFDLCDLQPAQASWACHPDARVPDTYRQARFISRKTGEVVVCGVVAKYALAQKVIVLEGTQGSALLDRARHIMHIRLHDGARWSRSFDANDTGYAMLAQAIAKRRDDAAFLTMPDANRVLHLVEAAHAIAEQVPLYQNAKLSDFFSDWQLPTLPAIDRLQADSAPVRLSRGCVLPASPFGGHGG